MSVRTLNGWVARRTWDAVSVHANDDEARERATERLGKSKELLRVYSEKCNCDRRERFGRRATMTDTRTPGAEFPLAIAAKADADAAEDEFWKEYRPTLLRTSSGRSTATVTTPNRRPGCWCLRPRPGSDADTDGSSPPPPSRTRLGSDPKPKPLRKSLPESAPSPPSPDDVTEPASADATDPAPAAAPAPAIVEVESKYAIPPGTRLPIPVRVIPPSTPPTANASPSVPTPNAAPKPSALCHRRECLVSRLKDSQRCCYRCERAQMRALQMASSVMASKWQCILYWTKRSLSTHNHSARRKIARAYNHSINRQIDVQDQSECRYPSTRSLRPGRRRQHSRARRVSR
jgi:hypothetical protein